MATSILRQRADVDIHHVSPPSRAGSHLLSSISGVVAIFLERRFWKSGPEACGAGPGPDLDLVTNLRSFLDSPETYLWHL